VSIIRVKDLKKYFKNTRAVDGISFEVEKGEIFGFLGPNGAGKTTTIRCMMDLLRPDEGEITILGMDAKADAPKLKRRIGYLSGDASFYEGWTGQEHISFEERVRGPSRIAKKLVKDFQFDSKAKVKNLSFGNKQKLGLIMALMHQPEVLILDEPTIGLDPLLQHKTYEILGKAASGGVTVFMSSHNLGEVERICGRVGIIRDGKLSSVDSVAGLKKKKIYNIFAYFTKKVPKSSFAGRGVEVVKEMPNGIVLRVKGDINPVLKQLHRYNLRDIEIVHESLEQVFMEFYK
jgi:ABC-2 type transport system ATP-binding protein